MLTILVANAKGGCGKTTVATQLAGALVARNHITALADCDRQRSAWRWVKRRPSHVPQVIGLDWSRGPGDLPPGIERLVVDAPAGLRRKGAKDLVKTADIILVPLLPSAFDADATLRFLRVLDKLKPIRKNRRVVAIVGNRLRPRSRPASDLKTFCDALEHPVVGWLRDSQLYPTAAAQGLSVFDSHNRRAQAAAEDWQPLLHLLDALAGDQGP